MRLSKHAGFNVDVKSEVEVDYSDAAGADLCISLGGDNTFLKTAAVIRDNNKMIFGVNSHPERHRGKLCNYDIFF